MRKRAATPLDAAVFDPAVLPSGKPTPVGTKDAPVDGKDGKPHAGPFVETGAERDRKKFKESGDEEPAISPFKGTVKDQYTEDDIPVSNDGVMDDPDRLGPKEGTRGTEGGVSEKSRESKLVDKVPDPPKEVPPLPHSEEEKIKIKGGKDVTKLVDDDKKFLEVLCSHCDGPTNSDQGL